MEQTSVEKPDRTGLWMALGGTGYLALCYGIVYAATGHLMSGEAFKAILAGTLGTGFVLLIAGAAREVALEKAAAGTKALAELGSAVLLLAVAAALAWTLAIPTFRHNPYTYSYGSATAQYDVTYTSGKHEVHSGAELGEEEWSWWSGFYLAITIPTAVAGAAGLLGALRRR